MIVLKKDYIKIVICVVLLAIASFFSYKSLKEHYDSLLSSTGLHSLQIEKKMEEENEKVAKENEQYNELLKAQDYSNQPEGGLMEEGEETKKSNSSTKRVVIPNLTLHALSSLLLDAGNNRVLYEENGYKKMAMASTTKIMTCIVALENAKLDTVVTISSYAQTMPDVQLNVKKGEQYYLKDLLYSLMLESHNDVAVAIAEAVGGSVEGFATMMNDKARELGCENTNFVTPNGLDAEGHYTTARDLAVIASYAIKQKTFIAITNTASHSFHEINNKRAFTVTNKNKFLYMMEGAIGVKTGFTNDAGYCFVGAVKREGKTLVSVVLGCGWPPSKALKWSDTSELMEYGVDNYKSTQIFEKKEFEPIYVEEGQQRFENLKIEGDLSLLLREDEDVKIIYDLPDKLSAPVLADTAVGKASYYIEDQLYEEIPIYTTQDILKIDFKFCIDQILKLWSRKY